jgi:dCMP deaminase
MSIEKWDEYFLGICNSVSKNSKCLSRQYGAILVKDNSIISTGYNGPPRGVPPCNERADWDSNMWNEFKKNKIEYHTFENQKICPRKLLGFKSGEGLDLCVAGHAERNALINAARNGICTSGTIMYMNCPVPCSACLTEIINAGVVYIVVTKMTYYDRSAEYLLTRSGLSCRTFKCIVDTNTSY